MLRIEVTDGVCKFDIEGDDKGVLAELTELGGLTLACLMGSDENAALPKAARELAMMRMMEAISADMLRIAGQVLDEGGLKADSGQAANE